MSELNEITSLINSSEIENDSDNEQKNNLVSDLKEANDILAYFKTEYGKSEPARYQKLVKEYEELRTTTIEAVRSENKVTITELNSIKKEFNDIKEIESYSDWWKRQGVEIKKSIDSNIADTISDFNDSLTIKDIIDILDALELFVSDKLRKKLINVIELLKSEGKTPLIMLKITNIMGEITGTSSTHNTAQEKYIKEITGNNKGYGNGYLVGYDNEKGNYVLKIDKFESYLSNPDTKIDGNQDDENVVNSKLFSSYFLYTLDITSKNIYETFRLIKSQTGTEKMNKLIKLWKTNDNTITQNILIENGYQDLVNLIKNPGSILNLDNPQIARSAIDIGGQEYIEDLTDYINKNLNNPLLKEKLEIFFGSKSDCPGEIQLQASFFMKLIEEGSPLSNEDTISINTNYIDEIEKQELIFMDGLKEIYNFGNMSLAPVQNGEFLNFGKAYQSTIKNHSTDFIIDTSEFIINQINSITDIKTLEKLYNYFSNNDFQICTVMLNFGSYQIELEKMYNHISEKYLEKTKDNLNNNILNMIINEGYTEKESQKITNEVIEKIKNKECSLTAIDEAIKVFKKYNIPFQQSQLSNIINNNITIQKIELTNSTNNILNEIGYDNSILKGKNIEEAINIINSLNISDDKKAKLLDDYKKANRLTKTEKRAAIIADLNENEWNNLLVRIESGEDHYEIMEDIKEEYENRKKIEKELEKSNTITNNATKSETIQNILQENSRISLHNGKPEIITKTGENIKLSDNDIKSVEQNPDNLDNIIHFSEVLIETGFENLWSAKDYLFKSIDNSIGIGFDINGDYLNTNELRIFFNTILKSLGYPEINGLADEQSIISHVKNLNDIQFGGETKDYNKDGDSKLENEFFKEFFPKDSALGFKSAKFEQAIA